MDLWRKEHWLPQGIEWDQLPTRFHDILSPIYLAIPILIIRILWESFVGVTIGHLLGYFGKEPLSSSISNHLFGGFARNTRAKRVLECFWRFSFYSFAWMYGFYALHDKSWLYNVRDCWVGYPFHPLDNVIWWYYMIEASFYYSLLLGAFFDVRRSDFWQLVLHHIVTIGLLSVSWIINFVRVGTLVLFSHDLADILLEGGKLTRYDRQLKNATNIIFVFFLLSWIVTRLGYYPIVLIRSAVFEAAGLIEPDYQMWNLFQAPYVPRLIIILLVALLLLHVFWTVLIVKVVAKTITSGGAGDVRSDSDSDAENSTLKKERRQIRTKKAPVNDDDDSDEEDEKAGRSNNGTVRRRPRKE